MIVPLEDFVPHDRSVRYRLHEAFYRSINGDPWRDGRIPYRASSNLAFVRQHAEVLLNVVADLERAGRLGAQSPVWILEIGTGSGAFAVSLLRALQSDLGEAGQRLLDRLRYVASDVNHRVVSDTTNGAALAAHVRAGVVVPAVFDLGQPERLLGLKGERLDQPFAAVIANYVCCVAPIKVLRRDGDAYFERYMRVELEVSDDTPPDRARPAQLLARLLRDPGAVGLMTGHRAPESWRPVQLDALLPEPLHGEIVRQTLSPFPQSTLPYPYAFLDCIAALRPRLLSGGAFFVSDYGYCDAQGIPDRVQRNPQHYGNVLNFAVEFAIFDAVAPLLGLSVARSNRPLASMHVAVLRNQPALPAGFADVVRQAYDERSDGDDLLDCAAAANALTVQGAHERAARMWLRCARLDPGDAEYLYKAAQACIEAGRYRLGRDLLEKGQQLDAEQRWDFDFLLGRAWFNLRQYDRARVCCEKSLVREPHPVTWSNLGSIHEELGDPDAAHKAYQQALALKPDHPRARERLAALASSRLKAE